MLEKLISLRILFLAVIMLGCAAKQEQVAHIETRPLEEYKAFEIIDEVLAERGYTSQRDVVLTLQNDAKVQSDYRIVDQKIAIEFLHEQDRVEIGEIPAPAAGSRLHVLSANAEPAEGRRRGESVFIFFIDDRKFIYHFNPTSKQRADVTFLEIDSRLRRDLADFLSWYENSIVKK
jgi:hypothetical protein